jgi:hypothetical protein
MRDFRLLVASTLPDAAFELSAPCHGNGSSGSPFSAGFRRMMMIFRYFSKNAPLFPQHRNLAVENPIPIRRGIHPDALSFRVWRHATGTPG